MNLRQAIVAITSFLFTLTCAPSFSDTISVAVAANMQFVFSELKMEFKRETGHDLQPVFNSSGRFVSQIVQGAPFDVLMVADVSYANTLAKQGLTHSVPKIIAFGTLVLWSMRAKDLDQWQTLLQSDQIRKIAIANPKTAPYGREAMNFLKNANLDQVLASRLVFSESIAQTNQYIFSGVVDIGFTSKSVVMSDEMWGKGVWIELPSSTYAPIAQVVVILKHGYNKSPHVTEKFFEFLSSAKAKKILQKNGYLIP